jgi:hypothetical protein
LAISAATPCRYIAFAHIHRQNAGTQSRLNYQKKTPHISFFEKNTYLYALKQKREPFIN